MQFVFLVCIALSYIYEDTDSLIVDNDSLMICGQHQYNVLVDIRNNGILYVRQWSGATDSTGWLLLHAPQILIQDSSSINGSTTGYTGGNNTHPDGYGPGYGEAGGISGGAGGGAGYGGYGGNGGDLYPGTGGSVYGDPFDTLINIGSGGGAGRYLYVVDGYGGNGGAMIYLKALKIMMDSSYIETDGEDGYIGTSVGFEAGGGGSGGGIMIWADSVIIHASFMDANGGNGADSEFGGGGGGAGGRIKIFYVHDLDTIGNWLSAYGGSAGTGSYGNPQPGEAGTVHLEQIVGMEAICDASVPGLRISPNPARTRLTIVADRPMGACDIYDVTGAKILSVDLLERTVSIDVHDLPNGVYLLRARDYDTLRRTFIILH